ncbi:DNA replication/repair protein RecF [uncultured Sphingorhabdus sp.]|uniref:DNA replication/repair protein RecF n=1 Tax=uncultured Sphingorhabdus sp. TaxID=1686106 RepID=UPI002609F42F|nr:DNA replication/repair protein RecF [uncultured Sphingorhabdus sp.]HMS20305.1 DNA replication/repair protein RecF [Sphingorhabdus sp.]
MALDRLDLTDFRNHAALSVRPHGRFIILHGANGAGKTNILEAVSLLVPGRGLRRSNLHEMSRQDGAGGFAVAATLNGTALGTAVSADAPGRRIVHINGANSAINDLAEWLSILWLTPAMDRLFMDGAGARRRFLDRLVLALEPSHALNSSRYENALRQRNRMLSEGQGDAAWFDAVEASMAQYAAAIIESRARTVAQLSERLAAMPPSPFAKPVLGLEDVAVPDTEMLAATWKSSRGRDRAAGRTLTGPHRNDLLVRHDGHGQPAASCSTGEQKALLLSLILAHAALVAELRGTPPILLLDEVAAHLDPGRREALFVRLYDTGSQVWMTGTEESLFDSAGNDALRLHIAESALG